MLIPSVALWRRFTHISHCGTDTLLVVAALYACAHLLWGPFHFISVGIFQMHRPSQTQPNTPKYTQKVPPDWGRGPHLWSTRGNKELIGHGCTRLVIVMGIGITGVNLKNYPHIISYHHVIQACYCSALCNCVNIWNLLGAHPARIYSHPEVWGGIVWIDWCQKWSVILSILIVESMLTADRLLRSWSWQELSTWDDPPSG